MRARGAPSTTAFGGGPPPRSGEERSYENHPDPVGEQGGFVLAFDLDGYGVEELILAGPLLLEAVQREAAAHPFAGADGGEEADAVEAVIDPHLHALGPQHDIGGHAAEQRQGEET